MRIERVAGLAIAANCAARHRARDGIRINWTFRQKCIGYRYITYFMAKVRHLLACSSFLSRLLCVFIFSGRLSCQVRSYIYIVEKFAPRGARDMYMESVSAALREKIVEREKETSKYPYEQFSREQQLRAKIVVWKR